PSFPVVGTADLDRCPANSRFSPDGRFLALGQAGGTVTIHAMPDGKEGNRLAVGETPSWRAYDHSGTGIAIGGGATELQVPNAKAGVLIRQFSHHGATNLAAWHPDGRLPAVPSDDLVYVWDMTTGGRHALLEDHQEEVSGVTFSPGG